ncbi:hypothetical Protein psc1_01610 [Candidatus Phytoplasma solani]
MLLVLTILFGLAAFTKYNKVVKYDACFYLFGATAITSILCCLCMAPKFFKNNTTSKEVLEFIMNIDDNFNNRKITIEEVRKISKKMD